MVDGGPLIQPASWHDPQGDPPSRQPPKHPPSTSTVTIQPPNHPTTQPPNHPPSTSTVTAALIKPSILLHPMMGVGTAVWIVCAGRCCRKGAWGCPPIYEARSLEQLQRCTRDGDPSELCERGRRSCIFSQMNASQHSWWSENRVPSSACFDIIQYWYYGMELRPNRRFFEPQSVIY